MMKQEIILITFSKNGIGTMNDLLSYITTYSSTKMIKETGFNIIYNAFGGYYNLLIKCKSKVNANAIKKIIKSYKERKE